MSGKAIKSLLIANRGEIAVRIIKTCRKLGIKAVLAASKEDLNSLPAQLADRCVCIGPARASDSYLKVEAIVQAALGTKVDAVHPGYGFLSENQKLAEACQKEGIIFIGPSPTQLDQLGDKLKARACAIAAQVPVTPGGSVASLKEALALAEKTGYPALIKAVSGGGGMGMKRVDSAAEMEEAVAMAISEAQASFGDPRVYLERYVVHGRHVEVQVLGDGKKVLHLGDRDCSIQRRFQKLIEEAPAPDIPDQVRQQMRSSAVEFAQSLNYCGLGTVEFLYDCDRAQVYFLEMNARIQVEHPVTEMIVDMDLVAEQIKVAEGKDLAFEQKDIRFSGHALECRINAENPHNRYQPSPGTISYASFPEGKAIRVDTHVASGSKISPFYDSMIAKLIVHGSNRREAIADMRAALNRCRVDGITTNISLHQKVLAHEKFQQGAVTTGFLESFFSDMAL